MSENRLLTPLFLLCFTANFAQGMSFNLFLHLPGFLYVGLTLVVGLAAVNRQNNLLFWILGVMLAALLISGLISGVMMQSLRV